MSLTARPNDRGFFQLGDVAPGTYALAVTAAGLAPAGAQPVEVLEGLETRLPHPFLLERPAALDVEVLPPVGPGAGAQWTVHVARRAVRGVLREVAAATLGEDGRWRFEGLATGRYRVEVVDSSGSRWSTREVDVAPGMAPLVVEIPLVEIEGVLSGVEEPAGVSIWFGGVRGSPRVGFVTDEEGRFSGYLPGEKSWPVDVFLRRGLRDPLSLEPVEVRRTPGQPVARIELEIPGTRLSGRVVDQEGHEVAGARVSAHGGTITPQRTIADDSGAFAFEGLHRGPYRVLAETDGAVSRQAPGGRRRAPGRRARPRPVPPAGAHGRRRRRPALPDARARRRDGLPGTAPPLGRPPRRGRGRGGCLGSSDDGAGRLRPLRGPAGIAGRGPDPSPLRERHAPARRRAAPVTAGELTRSPPPP